MPDNVSKLEEDKLRAQKLEGEIDKLGSDFPHTRRRANAVFDYLYGEKKPSKVATELEATESSIEKWTKIYLDEGIEGLKKMKNRSPTLIKTRTPEDKELSNSLKEEISTLTKDFPRTLIRANAVADYFNGEKTKVIATEVGTNERNIANWAKAYKKEGGFENLKKMEDRPVTTLKTDTPYDQELSGKLQKELLELPEGFPNTLIRGNALVAYFNGEKTKVIATKFGTTERNITNWAKAYKKEGGFDKLKKIENRTITLVKTDTPNDQELSGKLQKKLSELPEELPSTLKRANDLVGHFNSGKTKKEILRDVKASLKSISDWEKIYKRGDISELMSIDFTAIDQSQKKPNKNQDLINKLKEELSELHEVFFPNTRIRVNAILEHRQGGKSKKDITKKLNISSTSLDNWEKIYQKDGILELMNMESTPIGQQKKDTTKKLQLYHQLLAEMPDLHQDFPALKKANALASYFNGEVTKEKAASTINIGYSIFSEWIDTYKNYGIKGLQQMEHIDLGQRNEGSLQANLNALGGAPQNQEQRQQLTETGSKRSAISNDPLPSKKKGKHSL